MKSEVLHLQGNLTIARASDGFIYLTITDAKSKIRVIEAKLTPEQVGLAITGMALSDSIPLSYWADERIGKTREYKTELILSDLNQHPYHPYDNRLAHARALVAPYEVDGWVGNDADMLNHHRSVGNRQKVLFTRWVDEEICVHERPGQSCMCTTVPRHSHGSLGCQV